MPKRFGIVLLTIGVALTLLYLSPVTLSAQQNEIQRAHNTGYQNGVNDARSNRPMNLNTNDWHGDRLTAYQQGYEEGYRSIRGGGANGWQTYRDPEAQRAYQTGYQNGLHDWQNHRSMNLNTNDWHGDRLTAYQKGYQEGYRSGGGGGEYGWRSYQNTDDQRAYQAGYRNGTRDREANRPMNLNTDDWHGERLDIYRKAYEQGYRGIRGKDPDENYRH